MELVLKMPMGRMKRPREVGFKFTIFTTWLVCDVNGVDLDGISELDQEQAMADTLYCAAKWYYYDKGKQPKWLSRDKGKYWMDNMSVANSRKIAEAMNSVAYHVKETSENTKKK